MTQLKLGEIFKSRYLIKGILGKGGMGIVYDAFDQKQQGPCAIKLLLHHRKESEQYRQRLSAEMEVMSRLNHPNIVRIYDFSKGSQVTQETGIKLEHKSYAELSEPDEVPYLVMERLEGENLATLLKKTNRLNLGDALNLIQQALSALSHAHEQGIIHRDLKPENLFVVQNSNAAPYLKILDFGVAKDLESDVSLTASLDFPMIGTPHYMAPEQIKNQKVGPSCDLYSMGVIIYEILNAHPPFAMGSLKLPSELSILPANLKLTWLHIHTPPPPLEFETEFDQVIMQTLAKSAQDRPQSADELSKMLTVWTQKHKSLLSLSLPLEKHYDEQETIRLSSLSSLTAEALNEAAQTIKLSIPIDPRILDIDPPKAVTQNFRISNMWPSLNDSSNSESNFNHSSSPSSENKLEHLKSKSTFFQLDDWLRVLIYVLIFISISFSIFKVLSSNSSTVPTSTLKLNPIVAPKKELVYTDSEHNDDIDLNIQTAQDIKQLISDLQDVEPPLSKDLPKRVNQSMIHQAIKLIENRELRPELKSISDEQAKLYQAYLHTWQTLKNSSKLALIKLYEIKTQRLTTQQEQHIYALTLVRVDLKASATLRLKLAIKHFQIADRLFFAVQRSKRLEADLRDYHVRIKLYQRNKEWLVLLNSLKRLQKEQVLDSELSSLLSKAQDSSTLKNK